MIDELKQYVTLAQPAARDQIEHAFFHAQYIKLTPTCTTGGACTLKLLEVSVAADAQRTALPLSIYPGATMSTPEAAIDGDAATSAGGGAAATFIVIDLGAVKTFETVTITNDAVNPIDTLAVQWSADLPADWATVATQTVAAPGAGATAITNGLVGSGICLNQQDWLVADLTVCACTEFQNTPSTKFRDRGCAPLTSCNADEYESIAPVKALTNSDALADEFIYTSDRECEAFKDHGDTVHTTLCGETCADRPGSVVGVCDDGGVDAATSICAWGSDCADCGARTYDDCLPFYHVKVSSSQSEAWQGQYWNDDTVKCKLPDAVVSTSPGEAYAEILITDGLTWPYIAPAPKVAGSTTYTAGAFVADDAQKTLSAVDNFFKEDTGLPMWQTPANRAQVTVRLCEAEDCAGDALTGRVVGETPTDPAVETEPKGYDRSYFKVADAPFTQLKPCKDANTLVDNAAVYDSSLPIWIDSSDKGCDDYAINGFYCDLYGSSYLGDGNGLTANTACCACGGGERPNKYSLVVTARDPPADGESYDLLDPIGNTDFTTQLSNPETTAHTTAYYDPPSWSNDWIDDDCTPQRVDTCTFDVYVYDAELPTLTCPTELQVCTDGEAESTFNYATVTTTGYATVTGSSTRYTGDTPPRLYVTSVSDNVDADMFFDASDYSRTGDAEADYVVQHSRCAAGDLDADCADTTPYTQPPRVTATHAWTATTTRTEGARAADFSPPQYKIGLYTITFTAQDSFGNQASCDVSLQVRDCAPPRPVCVDETANTDPDVCYCTLTDLSVTATDNSGVPPQVLLTVDGMPIDNDFKFRIGTTDVLATATDMSGAVPCSHNAALNKIGACYPDAPFEGDDEASGASSRDLSATCNLRVTCTDNQDPVLVCPAVHSGSCDSQVPLADGSTYGTINTGISWPPPDITSSDNSGVVIPGTFTVRSGEFAGQEVTDATRFYWYESVQVEYTATDGGDAPRTTSCTFAVELACTIEKWARGADFTEVSTCGDGGGDQMSCLSAQDAAGTADEDGFVPLTLAALQTTPDGADRAALQPRTTAGVASVDGGTGVLGWDMLWKPTPLADPAADNLGTYTGASEEFDCDDTGIVDNAIKITDPDGVVKVVMQTVPIPVGVQSSKEVVYKYSYMFKPAAAADTLTIKRSGVKTGDAAGYTSTLVSTAAQTACREVSGHATTYLYAVDSRRAGGVTGKTCAELGAGAAWCRADGTDGTNWGLTAWDGIAWDADLAKSISLWQSTTTGVAPEPATGVFPATACCECGGGSYFTTEVGAVDLTEETVQFEFEVSSTHASTAAGFDNVHVGTRGCMDPTAATFDKNAIVSGKCSAGSAAPAVAAAAAKWHNKMECENPTKGTCFTVSQEARQAQYIRIKNEGGARALEVMDVVFEDEAGAEIDDAGMTPANLFDSNDATVVELDADETSITIDLGTLKQVSRIRLRQRSVIDRTVEGGTAPDNWGDNDGFEMVSVAYSVDATFSAAEEAAADYVDLARQWKPSTDTMSTHGSNPGIAGLDLPAGETETMRFAMDGTAATCTEVVEGAGNTDTDNNAPCAVDATELTPTPGTEDGCADTTDDDADACIYNLGSLARVQHGADDGKLVVRTDDGNNIGTVTTGVMWHELAVDVASDTTSAACTADPNGGATWWVAYKWFNEYCDTSACCSDPAATPATYSATCTADRHDYTVCSYENEAIRVHNIKDRLAALQVAQAQSKALLTEIRTVMKQHSWARANLIAQGGSGVPTSVVCHAGYERSGSRWFQTAAPCTACTGQTTSPSGLACAACGDGCSFVSASQPCSCPAAETPECTGNDFAGADGACHPCPAQSTVDATRSSCVLSCAPNTAPAGDGTCAPCAAGTVSATGASCAPCADGQYISQVITGSGAAVLSCTGCPASGCPADATGLTVGTAAAVAVTGALGALDGESNTAPVVDSDNCAAAPCLNGATCVESASAADGYTCTCAAGWSGAVCDVDDPADECASTPCTSLDGTASCENGISSYTCTCSSTFAGENCEDRVCGAGTQPVADSDPLVCEACTGDTYSPGSNVVCSACAVGTPTDAMTDCEVTCDCATLNLAEHTSCGGCDNRCRAACEAWETGSALDGCGGAFLLCSNTCTDNEVWDTTDLNCQPCGALAGDRNVLVSTTLCSVCPDGTERTSATGALDTACTAIECPAGTSLDVNTCVDVDECLFDADAGDLPPCNSIDEAATCTNGDNAFSCTCSTGFSGPTCEIQQDPCDPAVNAAPCGGAGACTALTTTTWECACNTGYEGETCQTCSDSYVRDGQLCVDDPCAPVNPCRANYSGTELVGGTCAFTTGTGSRCSCTLGFSGSTCGVFDPCTAGYCDNDELTPPDTKVYSMALAVPCEEASGAAWQTGFSADLAGLLSITSGVTIDSDRIQVLGVLCGSVLVNYVITPGEEGEPTAEELGTTIEVLSDYAAARINAQATGEAVAVPEALAELDAETLTSLDTAMDAAPSVGTTLLSAATVETTVVPQDPEVVVAPTETEDDFPVWAIIVIAIAGFLLLCCSSLLCCPGQCCDGVRNSLGIGKIGGAKKQDGAGK
eukprot:SAG22_NODE_32_length_27675_cov_12.130119_3_plen_2571_part_00